MEGQERRLKTQTLPSSISGEVRHQMEDIQLFLLSQGNLPDHRLSEVKKVLLFDIRQAKVHYGTSRVTSGAHLLYPHLQVQLVSETQLSAK